VYRFVERFASAMAEGGLPRMPARIFAALLCSEPGSMTANQLADYLQASPAAISSSVRYLIGIGMVNRESAPGSRQHHYRIPDDVWDQMVVIENRQTARWAALLREGVEIAGPGSATGRRISESADYMEFLGSEVLAIMKRWHEYRSAKQSGPA
jgi:DNA-binding transcriptional regulator GbsR (MarR family)